MAEPKLFTRAEVSTRNSRSDAVFIIDNVVYDVTQFLDEHPGGHEVLLHGAGRDVSEDFHDVGHSFDAKQLMQKFVAGEVVPAERVEVQRRAPSWEEAPPPEEGGLLSSWRLPLALGLLLTVLYSYLFA